METLSVKNRKEFEPLIDEIRTKYGSHKIKDYELSNQILFRGQADSEWPLTTTLERASGNTWTIRSYCSAVQGCSAEIQSFTDKIWPLPRYDELIKELDETFHPRRPHIPFYEYIVYLRQHSFPSPLLDWTSSPYIALFFALADKSNYKKCAVFVYVETPQGVKATSGGSPQIDVQGPYIRTHKRHFLQKAWYTIATCANSQTKDHEFLKHDQVFETKGSSIVEQDVLVKIEIPTQLRMEMLDHLDYYNINYFSLFQTEDSLMKAIARKDVES